MELPSTALEYTQNDWVPHTKVVHKETIGFENYERWATSPFDSTLELVRSAGVQKSSWGNA
jgi:hypothetical protein